MNVEKQEARSYRLKPIQGATILERGFTPRFEIELTPSGPLVAPEPARGSESALQQSPARHRHGGSVWAKAAYLYRCPICSKRFEHSSLNAALRAHKNPSGYPCDGRQGIYEGTR